MIFFFVCYFIQTRKPKCAAAKSYSKLVTANHKKKKKRDTGTGHAGDEEEEGGGSIISGNQDPSALIPTANYCLPPLMGV